MRADLVCHEKTKGDHCSDDMLMAESDTEKCITMLLYPLVACDAQQPHTVSDSRTLQSKLHRDRRGAIFPFNVCMAG